MAFIRPVCVRADTILAAVMIISYAFIKVLRRKGDKKGKKRNILRNRLIKIKRSEKGWGRFSIVALLVFQTLFFFSIPSTISEPNKHSEIFLSNKKISKADALFDWYGRAKLQFPYPLNTWSYGSFRSLRHSIQNYVQLQGYERSPRLVWNR